MEYTRIRFPTLFETIEAADADKKRLEIYDAKFSIDKMPSILGGILPKFIVDKYRRQKLEVGISWTTEMWGGHPCYVFHPCPMLKKGLDAKANYGWFKFSLEIGKKMTEMLGYQVMGLVE